MNLAHLHLLLNHFPIVGTALATLLLGAAIARRGERGLWLAGTLLLGVSGATAAAAWATGGPAEETVEGQPGVHESTIEAHEERAELATVFAVLLAAGAAGAYWVGGRSEARGSLAGPFGAAVVSSALMAWTGAAGGQIRHPEAELVASAGGSTEAGEANELGEATERGERGE